MYKINVQCIKAASYCGCVSCQQLGKLCFEQGDYTRLTRIIRQLHQSCQTEDGVDDVKKGTQLLEVGRNLHCTLEQVCVEITHAYVHAYLMEIDIYLSERSRSVVMGMKWWCV